MQGQHILVVKILSSVVSILLCIVVGRGVVVRDLLRNEEYGTLASFPGDSKFSAGINATSTVGFRTVRISWLFKPWFGRVSRPVVESCLNQLVSREFEAISWR